MGGKKVYHAGDTGLFLDMKLIAEMNGPFDAALLPIGDNFTMGIADAAKAAEFVDAAVAIPMHYDTFGWIEADPTEFVKRVQAGWPQSRGRQAGRRATPRDWGHSAFSYKIEKRGNSEVPFSCKAVSGELCTKKDSRVFSLFDFVGKSRMSPITTARRR